MSSGGTGGGGIIIIRPRVVEACKEPEFLAALQASSPRMHCHVVNILGQREEDIGASEVRFLLSAMTRVLDE